MLGWRERCRLLTLVAVLGIMTSSTAVASVNLPLHHWSYEAIERLVALGVIDRAMVVAKPYSRKQAAKYVARAIERIRADLVPSDGREVLVEPLLERLMQFLQPELVEIGALGVRSEALGVIRAGGRLQVEGDAFSVGHGRFRLPWVLSSLGEWRINTFLTQLERDRDFPRAEVFGLRLSYLPASWLELGANRLTQFDGRGSGQSFPKTILKVYGHQPNQEGALQVNEQASIDFRARVPSVPYLVPFPAGLQFYGEIGSEDKWSQLPLPSRVAFLTGIYIPQVFKGDTVDLRIEYADTDIGRRRHPELSDTWYNNGTYQSGMRYRGFPLGHWMGTDAIDLFVRSTRYLTDSLQLGANFELTERALGKPEHEKKREAGVDLTWYLSSHTQLSFAYTYQRIQNPGLITSIDPFAETFASGVTSNNHLLWTNLTVEY